ncbi:ADP-ribosylation factor-like protein 6-interacting protein 1 [Schistocerca cancellata]|uniref:ADP-ribosylation factor-like protein 6-interacting protein 1 n=1 Tax=Schistocerca cancellata TaxID=274614 RepID=UPI00211854EF|nr:ADP-ribosylation factor-like protein 6-interacting protein 1 [Schistocerca cancellata]
MADATSLSDQEKRVKKIKRDLEGWREVLIPLNSVLLWEKNWYPGMLFGITTTLFFLFWYLDPSVLTTISVVGLLTTLVDYLVPTLTASICHPDSWTGVKERQLEDICRSLASLQGQITHWICILSETRQSRPRLYYTSVVVALTFLAWLGNVMNNLLLTYILVTTIVMIPGLRCHPLFRKYFKHISTLVPSSDPKVKQKKN